MKKLKNLWANNKILMILGMILILCVIAILVVVLKYFVGSSSSVYGNRFDNMKVTIKSSDKETYTNKLEENKNVTATRIRESGKTLYISVTFTDETKMEDAKAVIESSLDNFSDDIKGTYDMNITIKNANFTSMASRNVSGNGIHWSNNTAASK